MGSTFHLCTPHIVPGMWSSGRMQEVYFNSIGIFIFEEFKR